ncbi:MAG: threonine-phosphate decarboxylase CobD [Pseudomonadota bacterium]
MITGHGGNRNELALRIGCDPGDITDMSSNINPLGPPPALMTHIRSQLSVIEALPEADAASLITDFAAHYRISPETVLAGNGTTQFIYMLPLALKTRHPLVFGPTYADYADACAMHDISCGWEMAEEAALFQPDIGRATRSISGADLVFICNPNNPTGTLIPSGEMERLCRRFSDTLFVIDESYMPFVPTAEGETLIQRRLPNVIVLHSMSKIFAIPGLRVGFVIASPDIISRLRRFQLPWSVNALAQAAVRFLLRHVSAVEAHILKSRAYISSEMRQLSASLAGIPGMISFPGAASFCLVKLPAPFSAEKVYHYLGEKRILIRKCSNFFGLSNRFIRISLKETPANHAVVEMLRNFCSTRMEEIAETITLTGQVF